MFKFNFELDDLEDTDPFDAPQETSTEAVTEEAVNSTLQTFKEHHIDELLTELPPDISYSPLTIPIPGSQPSSVTLSRRDLFDARFQLIASGAGEESAAASQDLAIPKTDLEFVEAPSDLVPGVYEGGLKTWECSIDLAAVLQQLLPPVPQWRSKRILELGCGTAIPSLFLLRSVFDAPPRSDRRIAIHMQDYNDLVFRLVTLPNIILAWYMSPASASFREAAPAPPTGTEDEAEPDTDPLPPADSSQPGELAFTPTLLTAFTSSLSLYGLSLRFFSGSWDTFDVRAAGGAYDVVLTSETIYRMESLPALLDLMWACTDLRSRAGEGLEEVTQAKLTITDDEREKLGQEGYQCIVAAKLVYFGVGGGVREFMQAVEAGAPSERGRRKGKVETLWKLEEGVKRNVMRVRWQ